MTPRNLRLWLCLALLSTLVGTACIRKLDPKKVRCTQNENCPSHYTCVSGHCVSGSTSTDGSPADQAGNSPDGGTPSGGIDGATDRPGGTGGTDGRTTNEVAPDAPPAATIGVSCTTDEQCASTHCVDGVCCEKTCGGCNACAYAMTGKGDGFCAPVMSGSDPNLACDDETASKPCGNDGTCDGEGACRKVGTNHVCAKASCNADGTFTPIATCSGKGECATVASQNCEGSPCAPETGCAKPCLTIADDCGPGNYCNVTTKTCAVKKGNGQPATQPVECTSNVVADGVCCEKECMGCRACTAELNGQEVTTTGQCLAVKAGIAAPHNACSAQPPCGWDGKCDGAGACRYTPANTACGASSCTGASLTKNVCEGTAHTCVPLNGACPDALICASPSACKTACATDTDCVTGNYCAAGACKPKGADGGSCSEDGQCQNGHCISGTCCNTVCGTCNACSTGTCKPVANGTDCGNGKVCNSGSCGACSNGSPCQPNNLCQTGALSCSTGSAQCLANGNQPVGTICGTNMVCNSTGTCVTCAAGVACQPNPNNSCQAGATSCLTGASVCVASGNQPAGTPCGAGMVCSSTGTCVSCAEGVACQPTNPCQTGATSCATGVSVCVANGTKTTGTSCGNNQVCNSTGQCVACTAGTSCQPTDPCQNGATSCATGASQCVASGAKSVGTSCGNNLVCNSSASCISCSAGTSCQPSDPCQNGAIACNSGAPVCTATTNKTAGTSCGNNLVCNSSASCVSCSAGTACQPSNACQNGAISCNTGAPVCGATTNKAAGTTCGTNLVCDGNGGCGACTTGSSCQPTNPCQNGSTACGSGAPVCNATTNKSAGTSCGLNQVCNSSASCIACTVGQGCQPTNQCQNGSITCNTGAPVCNFSSNKTAGTSCGTNQVCNGSGSCIPCTVGQSCQPTNPCQNGTIACSSGSPVCNFSGNKADGTSCGTNLVCSGGNCIASCAGPTFCGTCASNGFESGSATPWVVALNPMAVATNAATNAVASSVAKSSGSYSLRVPYSFGGTYGRGYEAGVGVHLCTSDTASLDGYTLSFDFNDAGDAMGNRHDYFMQVDGWGSSGLVCSSIFSFYAKAGNPWQPFAIALSCSGGASWIGIRFSTDGSSGAGDFSGTAYIDNIVLQQ